MQNIDPGPGPGYTESWPTSEHGPSKASSTDSNFLTKKYYNAQLVTVLLCQSFRENFGITLK